MRKQTYRYFVTSLSLNDMSVREKGFRAFSNAIRHYAKEITKDGTAVMIFMLDNRGRRRQVKNINYVVDESIRKVSWDNLMTVGDGTYGTGIADLCGEGDERSYVCSCDNDTSDDMMDFDQIFVLVCDDYD